MLSIESFKEFINIYLENREIDRFFVIESHILSALDINEGNSSLQIKKQITEQSISQYRSFLMKEPKDSRKRQKDIKIIRENNTKIPF